MPTIPSLFLHSVHLDMQVPFLHQLENDSWVSYSKKQAHEGVAGVAQRLFSLGVKAGTVVAICADTSKEWALLDIAIQSLGGISVGIYPTLTPSEIAEQLCDCGAMMLVVHDGAMYLRLEEVLDDIWDLMHILSFVECDELLPLLPAEADLEFFRQRVALVQASDIACIIYTSGTTGVSKGVPLTHAQLVYNLQAMADFSPLGTGQRAFVCLPLAHSLQRVALYRGLIEDIQGYFCSLADVSSQLLVVRPTLLIAVPRMLEKIQQQILKKAEERGSMASFCMEWASMLAQTTSESRRLSVQRSIAKILVYSTVFEGLGGSLQTIFCGGAPLRLDTARWFTALGIRVQEGWGLTETCAPATLNPSEDIRLGSVGKAFGDTVLRIAEDGEILVSGPGVFAGYWKKESLSCFTEDGFFMTGDIGYVDEDGYLWITGRKKDIIITAGGKNIAPQPIIARIVGGLIEDVVLMGDGQPYLCALIICPEDTFVDAHMKSYVADRIAQVNTELPRFSQIKKYRIFAQDVLDKRGLRTPTLKLKKKKIIEANIDLYEQK
jgi:long-chain acyl-CoA synthetase